MNATRALRRNVVVGAVLLLAVVVVGLVVASSGGDGDAPSAATGTTAAPAPTASTTPSGAVRATGAGSCAFLSTDDVRRATGGATVELLQMLGPNGNPGCEWALGDERRLLQLEFQTGRAPATLPAQGEDVPGPWRAGKWLATSRTLYVDAGGQILFVRAADNDPARAKDVSTAVAAMAADRN